MFSSVFPVRHLCSFFGPSVLSPECSWTVILSYPLPPGRPGRNNEQLSSNIVLKQVKISGVGKTSTFTEDEILSGLEGETVRSTRCGRAPVSSCVFWA